MSEYTKCQWIGDFAGAKVVRTFNDGPQRCQEWQKGLAKKTVCWEFTKSITKKFVKNGRKCVLYRQGFRTFPKCFGGLTGEYRWSKFDFKGAKLVKRFERQGQQCALYTKGQETFNKCEWKGSFAGARVVKRYNKGPNRCTIYRKGTINREVCWNNKLFIVKKFTENGKQCTLYKRLHRQFVYCPGAKPAAAKPGQVRRPAAAKPGQVRRPAAAKQGQVRRPALARPVVVRKFVREGQNCTTYK
jgi:hypothetical protein